MAPALAPLAGRGMCVQLQRWARAANGKQKQSKLHGGGENTNNIMSLELVTVLLVKQLPVE